MNQEEWVRLVSTPGITPAELLANRLQAAGIPARAVQEGAGEAIGLTVGILGDAWVLVPASRLQEAQELLDVEAYDDELELDLYVTCPYCDSDVELDDEEWEQGWFECPECNEVVDLDEYLDEE